LDLADHCRGRCGGFALFRPGLEIGLVGFAHEFGEHLVDAPTLAIEIGHDDRPLGPAEIATGSDEHGLGLVEQAPEAGDPRRSALLQIVGFLGGRTSVEVGLDQLVELTRRQDGPVGGGNGVLLRQARLRCVGERFGSEPRLRRPQGTAPDTATR
jgi:hypothetical protein